VRGLHKHPGTKTAADDWGQDELPLALIFNEIKSARTFKTSWKELRYKVWTEEYLEIRFKTYLNITIQCFYDFKEQKFFKILLKLLFLQS